MTLYKHLNDELLTARKEKNKTKALLLNTLIDSVKKSILKGLSLTQYGVLNPKDDEVLSVLKQYVKNANTTLSLKDDEKTKEELVILRSYLPKLISKEQTEEFVLELLKPLDKDQIDHKGKLLGVIMKGFKEKYPEQFDPQLVKQLVDQNV